MVTVCPSQFATRRTLFHVLVGCGLLMLKVSRLKLPVIWLLVSMWLYYNGSESATAISYTALVSYVTKYVNVKADMHLSAKRLPAAECNAPLIRMLSLGPRNLFRI